MMISSLLGIFLLSCFSPASPLGEDNFTAFKQMVYEHIELFEAFVVPTDNAAALTTTEETVQYFGTFDFIVVGAGAGGSVLASRLTEINDWRVLVLEAGQADSDFLKVLGLASYVGSSPYTWGYKSVLQERGCLANAGFGDRCDAGPGKVLGGSTNVNGANFARGHPEDYKRWEEVYGNVGWSYEDVLPYFKKSENASFASIDDPYRGHEGYITLTEQIDTPLSESFIGAFEELGHTYGDYNGPSSNRVSRFQLTLKGNERVSTSTAFVKPFLNRKNLILSVESFVTKVNVDNETKQAYGVQFVKDGINYSANVTKDVILSAGGYNSAQILLLSGIGPREDLEELNIPVIDDLPVGRNFQDHLVSLSIVVKTNQTLYNYTMDEKLLEYVNHRRPLICGLDIVAFLNLEGDDAKRPDVEHYISFDASATDLIEVDSLSDVVLRTVHLHPKFRGKITLKSKNPLDHPVIDYQLLSETEDIDMLYRLQQSILALNNTQALEKIGGSLHVLEYSECPEEYNSKEWWYCVIRRSTRLSNHPVGANSMGSNKTMSVVNPRGRVHGFLGLIVADESVIPESISGHNMAPTIMIAERVADFVKEDYNSL